MGASHGLYGVSVIVLQAVRLAAMTPLGPPADKLQVPPLLPGKAL